MQMNIHMRFGITVISTHPIHFSSSQGSHTFTTAASSSYASRCYPFKIICSRRDFRQSQQNGGDNGKGERSSTDWDTAWSNFRKKGKKTLFSQFSPNKYVTWNPRRSEFPLSEEVDPVKRTERSTLLFWTSPRFTLAIAIVIVTLLLVYTILVPAK